MDCEKRCRNEAYHHFYHHHPARWPASNCTGLARSGLLAPNLARPLRRALASATGLRGVGSRPAPSDHSVEREGVSVGSVVNVQKRKHFHFERAQSDPCGTRQNQTCPAIAPGRPYSGLSHSPLQGGVAATPPERIHGPLDGCAGRLGQSPPVGSAISAADSRAIAPVTSDLPSGA